MESANPKIKIILVDDHQIILDSLSQLLNYIPQIEIVRTFENASEVLPFLESNKVDLVLSDANMPDISGIDLSLAIRSRFPHQKIILLTMVENASFIKEAIQAGISGYVFKKTGKEELEKAISSVLSGKKYFSAGVVEQLATFADLDLNDVTPKNIHHLTSREIEIIKLIALENTSQEIADSLFISLATVETHRSNIMKKLQIKSSIGMIKYALKHKLIEN